MKKVIEILEKAIDATNQISAYSAAYAIRDSKKDIVRLIDEALVVLKAPPRWETPEQWEERTGERYSDKKPVFGLYDGHWHYWNYKYARNIPIDIMVIAPDLESPPDDWRPE